PSGHLPVTFYRSLGDLPDYKDYGMKGRTYRYYNGPVQYPFGYGLSYAAFDYTWQSQPKKMYTAKDSIAFSVTVSNKGDMNADEVVQAYIEYPTGERMPVKELKAFRRISVSAHDSRLLTLSIPVSELQKWDLATGKWKLYKGEYKLVLGSHSRDEKLTTAFTTR
ncbi:MAG TPA: fibronectin type III-like domain-contianing protein, partial [Puia sp.]|nr:fibronectin type III-like domain-contianing protein [Puia sp.]